MLVMAKIFSMSEAASIAIHGMVLIARAESGINAIKIAEFTGSSKNHISKVCQRLVKNDLLKSVRGPSGGFTLKKAPQDITLLNIYESIEGAMEISDCPFEYEVCKFDKCLMDNVVNKLAMEFRNFLNSQTLKDYI
jgi:Rrf2 family protein